MRLFTRASLLEICKVSRLFKRIVLSYFFALFEPSLHNLFIKLAMCEKICCILPLLYNCNTRIIMYAFVGEVGAIVVSNGCRTRPS